MNKRKVLIIGIGGIGSYLAPVLDKTGLYELTVADPDELEKKNLLYQNYRTSEFLVSDSKKKVDSLHLANAKKIPFEVITDEQIEVGYDLIVCCADNLDVRRLVYRQGFQSECGVKWLDLRAQGRNGALISYLTDPKHCDTFLAGPDGSFSCQGESFSNSLDAKDLHFTHVAIAGMAAQWIQRWFNQEKVYDKRIVNL
tara:strand:+ start:325 stop:918 length:594 start_codon:yes stop_codon:yes gene_type:complete